MQREVDVLRRNGREVLGDVLLRIGVARASELRVNRRCLRSADSVTSAKGHVLLRMGHSGESLRRFIGARDVVLFYSRDGRQRIADDNHAHTVIKRGARYGFWWCC